MNRSILLLVFACLTGAPLFGMRTAAPWGINTAEQIAYFEQHKEQVLRCAFDRIKTIAEYGPRTTREQGCNKTSDLQYIAVRLDESLCWVEKNLPMPAVAEASKAFTLLRDTALYLLEPRRYQNCEAQALGDSLRDGRCRSARPLRYCCPLDLHS